MLSAYIPWASSIQCGQELSRWRRERSPWQGNLDPRTGLPSWDIHVSAAQRISHLTVCSQPGLWTSSLLGRISASGGEAGEVTRDGVLLSVWCRDKSDRWVGLEGPHPPGGNWFVLLWQSTSPLVAHTVPSVLFIYFSFLRIGLPNTGRSYSWLFCIVELIAMIFA